MLLTRILFLAAVLASPAGAAEERLKKINVAAIDHEGQPVSGLQPNDFQLLEDGKPRKIAFLRFTGDHPPTAKAEAHEYTNEAGAPLRATVILIDLLNDRTMSGSIINEDTAHALKNLESSEGLYLYFLTASGQLYPVHALPAPGPAMVPAPHAEPWTRNIAPMLQDALKNVFSMRPVDERDISVRYDLSVKAILELAPQMRSISGRKTLIWVTHGVPLLGFSISQQGAVDFTNGVHRICQALEQTQIVVYPVEQSMRGAAAAMATESDQLLEEFSGLTGGRIYRSGGIADAVPQSTTDARANYQLAYYSTALNPDGKHHKLRLVCTRKEVRLQTVSGLYVMAPLAPRSDVIRNAFVAAISSPFDATEIGLRASVAADPENKQKTQFQIRVDPQDHLSDKLLLVFAAYGAKGLEQPGPPVAINVAGGKSEVRQSIAVAADVTKVRIIVVDEELGAVGSLTIPIEH